MNCLKIGCRTRVLTDVGEFEGTIQSFDVQLGLIAMKNVLCLKNQKKLPDISKFMKNEIKKLTILSEPKSKNKRTLLDNVQQRATDTAVSDKVKEESSGRSLQDVIPKSSGKLSEEIKETKTNTRVLVQSKPVVEAPSTEQALLGGVPSQSFEKGSQCLGEGQNGASDYFLLEEITDEFYLAINKIKSTAAIGLAMEGVSIGRNGQLSWIMISTRHHVFLFDVLSLGEELLIGVLRSVFENENILKVVHDCRAISDLLFHRHSIKFVNIFDTQVASVILFQKDHHCLPKSVDSLVVCILEHLNLPDEVIYTQKNLANKFKSNPSVWNVRPATDNVLQVAVFSVRYLRELRLRLIEKMLLDFVNGVDIYLGVWRDASETHLARLQNLSHMLPMEFQSLQFNADASRRRMEELYNKEPEFHKAAGCLATVDKFTVSDENVKPYSPELMNSWKNNDYDSKQEFFAEDASGRPADERYNDVKGQDHDKSKSGEVLTLAEVIKLKSETAPKSDDFILVASGSEPTQFASCQKKSKRIARKFSTFDSEIRISDSENGVCAKPDSRRVPMFDDFSVIPSSSEPTFYIGRCTTDGFSTSSDDNVTPEVVKCNEKVVTGGGSDQPGIAGTDQRSSKDFGALYNNISNGCTPSASDERIHESFSTPSVPSLGRGACVLKLLGLGEPPRPGQVAVTGATK